MLQAIFTRKRKAKYYECVTKRKVLSVGEKAGLSLCSGMSKATVTEEEAGAGKSQVGKVRFPGKIYFSDDDFRRSVHRLFPSSKRHMMPPLKKILCRASLSVCSRSVHHVQSRAKALPRSSILPWRTFSSRCQISRPIGNELDRHFGSFSLFPTYYFDESEIKYLLAFLLHLSIKRNNKIIRRHQNNALSRLLFTYFTISVIKYGFDYLLASSFSDVFASYR